MASVEESGRRAVGDGACTELDVGARTEMDVSVRGSVGFAGPDRERLRGVTIGRYVLLTKLGEGGMGVVWAAYDPELDRRLALKVLRRAGDSDRLLREAQALARLAHPNVVAIHDVGEDDGEVWLAMELVEGQTLDAWCEADPSRSWGEILAVLLPAGHGVAAAHSAGLIHRDLKPENLMVGRDGRARVMDFGLARSGELVATATGTASAEDPLASTDSSLLSSSVTRAGAIVGTPLYMAPEQFAGAVDERSDLFAFCVVLWEALYGARPFPGENVVGMVYAITQGVVQEGPRGRSVPRWLRRVLLRGLEGSPEARWQSMKDLLAAIEGGLARERWRRLALLLALLAVIGLGAVAWGLVEERRQRSACAGEAASIVALWPGQAPEAFMAIQKAGIGNADETVDKLGPILGAWAEGWAESREELCLGGVDPRAEPELAKRALDCSELQRSELEGFLEILGDGEQGVVLQTVEAGLALSKPSECLDPAYLRELVLPDPAQRDEVSDVLVRLRRVQTMLTLAKFDDALTLAQAAQADAERLGWAPLFALAEVRVGQALLRNGRYADAEERLRRGLGGALAVGDGRLAITAIYHLGYVAHDLKKPEVGLAWLDTADGLLRRDGAERGAVGTRILGVRAILYKDLGQLAKAGAIFDELLPLVDELFGRESLTATTHLNNAALLRVELGDVIGAREMHLRVQELREAFLGPHHPRVAASLLNRGLTHMRADEFDLARPLLERALEIDERAYGAEDPRIARTLNVLSVTLSELSEFEAATRLGERVLAIREATFGADHLEYASALNNHGVSLAEQGKSAEARALHLRALEIRRAHFGDEGNAVARSHTNLGELDLVAGDVAGAIEHLERAVAIREGIEVSPISLAYSRFALARAVATLDPARATELATLALRAYEESDHKRVEEVQGWIAAHEQGARRTKRNRKRKRRSSK